MEAVAHLVDQEPEEAQIVLDGASGIVHRERLSLRKDLGARVVLGDLREEGVEERRLLDRNRPQRGEDGVSFEGDTEDQPHGVVDRLRQREIELGVPLEEDDPVVAKEAELDPGELGVPPEIPPVEVIGDPVAVGVRTSAGGVVGMGVVDVVHPVTVHVDVALCQLAEIVAHAVVRDPVAVPVAHRKGFEIVANTVELVEEVECFGLDTLPHLPKARELGTPWHFDLQRSSIAGRVRTVGDVTQRRDLLRVQERVVDSLRAKLLETLEEPLSPGRLCRRRHGGEADANGGHTCRRGRPPELRSPLPGHRATLTPRRRQGKNKLSIAIPTSAKLWTPPDGPGEESS